MYLCKLIWSFPLHFLFSITCVNLSMCNFVKSEYLNWIRWTITGNYILGYTKHLNLLKLLNFERRTLGSDDLTIFKCFRVIFSLKKKTIQFPLSFNLYFQQKSPKVVNLPLTDETLCLNFWRHKQDKWLLQFLKLSWGSYVLFNSLAKSCTLFWKCS